MFLVWPGLCECGNSPDSPFILSTEGAGMKANGLTVVPGDEIRPRTQPPHIDIGTTEDCSIFFLIIPYQPEASISKMFCYYTTSPSHPQTHTLGQSWRQLCLLGTTAPEKTSWLLQVCSFPAEAEPAFLNLFAKFMCPQMVLLTVRSNQKALEHLHCFKRMEEMSASNHHIYSCFFSPVETDPTPFENLQIFHICLECRFLSRFSESWSHWHMAVSNIVAECKHHLLLAQPNLPFRPCWGQGGVSMRWNSPRGCWEWYFSVCRDLKEKNWTR